MSDEFAIVLFEAEMRPPQYNSASEEIAALKARIKELEEECLLYRMRVGMIRNDGPRIKVPVTLVMGKR